MLLSGGAVVYHRGPARVRYLLLRAFRNWDFPKGLVEAGEEPRASAVREVREETGLSRFSLRHPEWFVETEPYGSPRKIARYYLVEAAEEHVTLPVNPELGRPEHHEARWCEYDQALVLLVPRLSKVLAWAHGVVGASGS